MTAPLSRRNFLAHAAAPALLAQKKKTASLRPNILLILADDLAAWMLGCYGNKEIKTPNIDTLARTGARFLNNFVCTPICSASRATLFTGRTPMQHGIHDFLTAKPVENPPQGQAAPPASFASETMISDVLSQAGYSCGYVGKWHMGGDPTPGHGYKHSCTIEGRRYQDPFVYRNGQKVEEKGYLTELMTSEACRFLDQQKAGEPFFLVASYLNPHLPYDGHPQKYYDLYAKTSFDTIGWERPARNALREKELLNDTVGNLRKCAASTTALDDQIPVLRRKLQERGLLDNTLVVFTGDNGFLLGRHGLWSKGLASDPINMYDEVVATPMIWSWPGRIPAEHVRPEMVSFYDLMPSLCDVADATPPDRNLCGRSYFPLAANIPLPKKQPWRTTVFSHFRNTEMARDNRFKLVLRNDGQGPNEFYDLRQDPREKNNLYAEPRIVTVRDRLRKELETWRSKYSS